MSGFVPSPAILEAALEHAGQCAPNESCGVIIAGRFHPVTNRSTRFDAFCADPGELVALEREHGPYQVVVHSHVFAQPAASEADRSACETLGVPWLIVAWPSGRHAVIEPCGFMAPLRGREWAWRYGDCYALIRDGFKAYTGLSLPDFDRQWEWWRAGDDLITAHFADAGFCDLGPKAKPQHCDVVGMRVMGPVVNHLGLFLEPDRLLHHMMGRLSNEIVFGGVYRQATRSIFRHQSFLEGPPA